MKKALLYFLLFSSSFLHAQFYELGLGGSGTLFHGDVERLELMLRGRMDSYQTNLWVKSPYVVNTIGIGVHERIITVAT